jgi:Ser-tRNA(Ala) deacylase AlaX
MGTYLACLDDTYVYEDEATLAEIKSFEDGRIGLVLDRTIFYPQGGGQPADHGTIYLDDREFSVGDVRNLDGVIYHFSTVLPSEFQTGKKVRLVVARERRILNSRLHTAGHLLDVAVQNLGLNLSPGKAYHFPDGPYVEYEGEPASADKEAVTREVGSEANRLIASNLPVSVVVTNSEEAAKLCGGLPEYVDRGKPIRVVSIGDGIGCPCAGTHLRNVGEIGPLVISKIKTKGGKTRVSYLLN